MIPTAPARRRSGMICLTVASSRIVSTACQSSSLNGETVGDVMANRGHMPSVDVSEPASEAWIRLADGSVDRLAVTDHGTLVGFIDCLRLQRYLDLAGSEHAPPRAA